ncbi:unnamed protein product (macronuclear) [Paramecium tetraurelia]|uniref:LITAF domain-containing protein n=1 Tax=Paramecium tetraurelia TaxID=5888 RepID=A0E6H9_PARTE|nr:uncharacterized protein GSPATT00003761001 [Paramecium tetraurelia]CAK90896.1 unnamed protein product [Paramecium tetraurelia]|eukprot:XP_001458293.1 hypothetical protein (macronuclear) [Paramecium tetraurelia strain d4-2]
MNKKDDPYQLNISYETDPIKTNVMSHGQQLSSQGIENQMNLPTELDDYEGPTLFYCNHCRMDSVSTCEFEASGQTFLCAFLLFFILNIFGCLIPYSSNACKNRRQICPRCRNVIGIKYYNACAC